MSEREGYILIDHRASPGLPEDVAVRIGLDPRLVGEGRVLEAATLTCVHCATPQIMNLERKRERHKCPKCNHQYVCDGCWIRMQEPDYVHQSYDEKVDHWLTGK